MGAATRDSQVPSRTPSDRRSARHTRRVSSRRGLRAALDTGSTPRSPACWAGTRLKGRRRSAPDEPSHARGLEQLADEVNALEHALPAELRRRIPGIRGPYSRPYSLWPGRPVARQRGQIHEAWRVVQHQRRFVETPASADCSGMAAPSYGVSGSRYNSIACCRSRRCPSAPASFSERSPSSGRVPEIAGDQSNVTPEVRRADRRACCLADTRGQGAGGSLRRTSTRTRG